MDSGKMKGKLQKAKGHIEGKTGKLVGSKSLESKGQRDIIQGKIKERIVGQKEKLNRDIDD